MSFDYLRYPPQLYKLQPKISQAVEINQNGKKTRKLFYRVPFHQDEINKIQQLKRYAAKNNKKIDCSDTQILRYLYSAHFNQKQCLEKISVYLDWIHDIAIQTLNPKARRILSEGAIYTFGRDKLSRPVIYLELTKINLSRYQINDYYCAMNAVIGLVVKQCFVHGVIQNYLFIIDMGGKNFTSLPIQAIGSIIKKLSIVYSNYLGNMLVINAHTFVKLTYTTIKIFIHQDTRKKITLLDCKQLQKLSDHIQKQQLFKKHLGFVNDPIDYWPPQVPGQKKVKFFDEQTVYYSVEQNQNIFQQSYGMQNRQNNQNCCRLENCGNMESCSIF